MGTKTGGNKMFGLTSPLDGAARPRPGLGIKVDRPKTPKLEEGIHYTAAQIAGPKAKGTRTRNGLVHMPHKYHG